MIKIAEEQAVQAEVLGATSSLVDRGIIHLASYEELEGFVKEASDYLLEQGYNTPEQLVAGVIDVYDYLTKNASDLAYEEEDMEPEDYEEDAEDAEEDTVAEVLKQASDPEDAMNMFAELYDAGELSAGTLNKVASAYEDGELEKIALFRKKTFRQRAGKKMREVGKSVSKKWKKLSPAAKRAIKGSGAAAALGGAGAAGYFLGRKN